MHDWIEYALPPSQRRNAVVLWSVHALRDKHLTPADVDFENNVTYLVIGGLHPDFIRIVTVIKTKGRI